MSKILIIEDDPFLLKLYDEILSTAGFKVEKAEDGESGKKKIESSKPDLVLLDIMLPRMNGLDLLEELRANPEHKDLKVVIITNLASESDRERAQKLGALKFIVKTQYDPEQVVNIIKEVVTPQ